VERRQLGLFNIIYFYLKNRFFPCNRLAVVVVGELEGKALALAGRHAARRRLELGQHATLAQHEGESLRLAAFERLAVERAVEVHGQAIAVARRARRRDEAGALLAQD